MTLEPLEPPPTPWPFPSPTGAPDDLVCLGADLEPGTILAAYRAGLFPMPYDRRRLGWWSPNPRGIPVRSRSLEFGSRMRSKIERLMAFSARLESRGQSQRLVWKALTLLTCTSKAASARARMG